MRGRRCHSARALMEACLRHSWPGNLRELSNFIKRYLVLGDESLAASELQPRPDGGGAALPSEDAAARRLQVPTAPGGLKSVARNAKDEAEAEAIARALEADELEPETGRSALEDQLQSAALQNPPVRYSAKPQHAPPVGGRVIENFEVICGPRAGRR